MSTLIALSVSGGKDSTAAALHLVERNIPFTPVFMDTGWEHAATYRYLDEVLEPLIGPITRLSDLIEVPPAVNGIDIPGRVAEIEALLGRPSAMVRWSVKKGMFPSRRRRWCTQQLKIFPFLAWAEALEIEENAVGVRAAESTARSRLPEREPMPGAEWLEVWRPLIRWLVEDVIAIHQRHGVRPNPLYFDGASRVGCWPCIMSRKAEIRHIADVDPTRVRIIAMLEALVGEIADQRETAHSRPTLFQAPLRDENGQRLCWPIQKVIAWSRTSHGGRQVELFAPTVTEEGCVRWGMCDTNNREVT